MKVFPSISMVLIGISLAFCGGPDNGGDEGLALLAAATESVGGCEVFTGEVTTTGGTTKTTEVNASAYECWTYVDLKSGGAKTTVDGDWDLKFKRFVIGTNSGTSGSGSAGSCDSGKTASNFGTVAITDGDCNVDAPTGGMTVDEAQTASGGGGFGSANESASPVLFEWYDYGQLDHTLNPKDKSYVIRASNGTSYFAFKMVGYYSTVSGTSGYPRFDWKPL